MDSSVIISVIGLIGSLGTILFTVYQSSRKTSDTIKLGDAEFLRTQIYTKADFEKEKQSIRNELKEFYEEKIRLIIESHTREVNSLKDIINDLQDQLNGKVDKKRSDEVIPHRIEDFTG